MINRTPPSLLEFPNSQLISTLNPNHRLTLQPHRLRSPHQEIIKNRQKSIGIRKKFMKNATPIKMAKDNSTQLPFSFTQSPQKMQTLNIQSPSQNKMSSYQIYKLNQKNDKIRHLMPLYDDRKSNHELTSTLRVREARNKSMKDRVSWKESEGRFLMTSAAVVHQKNHLNSRFQSLQTNRKSSTSGNIRHKKFSFENVYHARSTVFQNEFRPWSPIHEQLHLRKDINNSEEVHAFLE